MNTLVLDLETYFDKSYRLKKIPTLQYVHDPRFKVHGLAVRSPDGQAGFKTDVPAALRDLQERYGNNLENATVVCHNAAFDLYVLNHVYGIRPAVFVDTMLLAYHVHGRKDKGQGADASLKGLAARYGLQCKGDLDFMLGIREPDAKQLAELIEYATTDVAITYELFKRLLPQVSRLGMEVPLMMHTIRLFTERGVHVDVEGIATIRQEILTEMDTMLEDADATLKEISGNKQFEDLLASRLARTGRQLSTKPGKRGPIAAIAKTDEAMMGLLEDDDPQVRGLAKARLGKTSMNQKLSRLNTLEELTCATGGRLPMELVYYGAHTGRFAGRGFNVQNMDRSGYGLKIRQLLMPAPGHRFVIADLAQIEARITAWVAGQTDMLEAFAQGRDIYSEFASEVFGEEVRKPHEDDSAELAARLGSRRQVGKQAVLGLGFGMGALKFRDTLKKDAKTAVLFDTGQITDADCRRIVDTFRERYESIASYWNAIEDLARNAMSGGRWTVNGTTTFDRKKSTLHLTLPSGRELRYVNPRLEWADKSVKYLDRDGDEAEFSPSGESLVYGEGDFTTSLYGGKLTENIVQATARDILVEAILAIEQAGLPVVFHVHDEVIVEVPEDQAGQALELVQSTLVQPPSWAPGLPIACEAEVAERYGK